MNRVLCQPGVQIIHAKPQLVTLQVAKSSDATHPAAGGVLNVSGLTTPQNIAIVSQVASSSGGTGGTTALQKIQSPQHIQVKQVQHVQHVVPVTQQACAQTVAGQAHVVGQLTKPLGQLQSSLQLQQQNNGTGAMQMKHLALAKQTVQAGKIQQVHVKTQSPAQQVQQQTPPTVGSSQPKSSSLPRQLLQHKVLLQVRRYLVELIYDNTNNNNSFEYS